MNYSNGGLTQWKLKHATNYQKKLQNNISFYFEQTQQVYQTQQA